MSLTGTANLIYDSLLSILYPQPCAVCGGLVEARADGVACTACWEQVRLFTDFNSLCWKCGSFSLGTIPEEQREQVRCHRCDTDRYTAARACGLYEGALRASVLALKREQNLCRRLTRMMLDLQSYPPLDRATRIVPVPLHEQRERKRGFNQAAVIARQLARTTSLPCDESCVIRNRGSERHRAGMDRKGRRDTVENAFEVRQPRVVSGERILLTDDVFTTGATASACADALIAAGAEEVLVLTLARPFRY